MASQRKLVAVARRAILADFAAQLEHAPVASLAQVTAVSTLLGEFRRRARQPGRTPPPGHEALPGLEVSC